jgi:hypothetical protein
MRTTPGVAEDYQKDANAFCTVYCIKSKWIWKHAVITRKQGG